MLLLAAWRPSDRMILSPSHILMRLRALSLCVSLASATVPLASAYISIAVQASWIGEVVLFPGRVGWVRPSDSGQADGSGPPTNVIPSLWVNANGSSISSLLTTSGFVHGFASDGEWSECGYRALPLWIPVAVGLGTYLAARLAGGALSRRGGCRRCGYSRLGLCSDALCPECGDESSKERAPSHE